MGSISRTPQMGIGIVFPSLMPFFGQQGVYVVSIMYVAVIAGYIASPMHLCPVLAQLLRV